MSDNLFFRLRTDSWIEGNSPITATVRGIYSHSFDAVSDKLLLNFHCRKDVLTPLSILVPIETIRSSDRDQNVTVEFPHLRIGAQFLTFEGYFPEILPPKDFEKGLLKRNAEFVGKSLRIFGKRSSVGEAYLDHAGNDFRTPIDSILQNVLRQSIPLGRFIHFFGGGAGLTPSWDDFCAGFMFADKFLGLGKVQSSKDFFAALQPRTTIQAYWQLKFAESAKSSTLFEDFLARFCHFEVSTSDIVRCVAVGHTSGTDILCGIHARIAAFTQE